MVGGCVGGVRRRRKQRKDNRNGVNTMIESGERVSRHVSEGDYEQRY